MPPIKGSSNSKKHNGSNNSTVVPNPSNSKVSSNNAVKNLTHASVMANKKSAMLTISTDKSTSSMNLVLSPMTMAKRLQKNTSTKPQKSKSSSNKVSTFVSNSAGKGLSMRQGSKILVASLPKQPNAAIIVPFSSNFVSQIQHNTALINRLLGKSHNNENTKRVEISDSSLDIIRFTN